MNTSSSINLSIKHNGKIIVFEYLPKSCKLLELKNEIYSRTNIPPHRQKLLGLIAETGFIVNDELPLEKLILKPTTKLMLIGSTEESINKLSNCSDLMPGLVDDLEYKEEELFTCQRPENIEKIKKRSLTYKFTILSDPRPDKRLLVLDIDYTILDHLTPAESVRHLVRPYLHQMLARAYTNYDIAIWSATSMTWIVAKMKQMGLISPETANRIQQHDVDLSNTEEPATDISAVNTSSSADSSKPEYRLCMLIDSRAMISVSLGDRGVKEIKPLAVIWRRFPHWGPHNTIMFDDVRTNFIMNPSSGLRIHPYRDATINQHKDKELIGLADYLDLIALDDSDFSSLDHNRWTQYVSTYKHKIKRNVESLHTDTDMAFTSTNSLATSHDSEASGDSIVSASSANKVGDVMNQKPDSLFDP